MNIRVKVITTIIAMVCSLSVSATGIAVILLDVPISVENSKLIAISDVRGDLYGERYGANGQDLVLQHLFKNGSGVQESEMNYFCQDVSFSNGSKQIEYVFKFILAKDAESGVFVELTDGGLTNTAIYEAKYSYGYGKERPDWAKEGANLEPKTKYVVDNEHAIIWLRATLSLKPDRYERLDTSAVWSFSFTFTGIAPAEA